MDFASMDFSKLLSQVQTHSYFTLVRERHLDTFGHVNNAQYMMLFEEARWEMITSRGYGLEQVQANQVGTVVLECKIRFKRELKLRDQIEIRSQVTSLSKKIITVSHQILTASGEIAAEAQFTMGCFDLRTRKLITPTLDWVSAVTGIRF